MTAGPTKPEPRRDGGSEPVDAPEAPVSGAEEERTAYAAEHPEAPESAGGDEAERLEGDIAELQSKADERDEYLALAQRTQADFENYRRRMARENAQAGERGVAKVARELLPALDHLELALKAAEGHEDVVKGFAMVSGELQAALGRVGIEAFAPQGEPFDPNEHEAMAQAPIEGAEPGTVAEVYQQGYRINGVVLRPARVVVAS
jgi:molecular chaperone GrpE